MLSAHEIIIKNLLEIRDENRRSVERPQPLLEKHSFEKITKEPGRKTKAVTKSSFQRENLQNLQAKRLLKL